MKSLLSIISFLIFTSDAWAQSKPAGRKIKSDGDNFEAASSTKFDFSEMSVDGKFKAPAGFFLSGRNAQDMTNMVKLRSNFRSELGQSKSQTKVIVK